jgi:hypothetical protein
MLGTISTLLLLPFLMTSTLSLSKPIKVTDYASQKQSSFRSALLLIIYAGWLHVFVFATSLLGVSIPGFNGWTTSGIDHFMGHVVAVPLMQLGLLLAYHVMSRVYPDLDLLSHIFIIVHIFRSLLLFFMRNNVGFIDWNQWNGARHMNQSYVTTLPSPFNVKITHEHPLALLYSAWPAIWIGMQIAGRFLQEHMSGASSPSLYKSNFLRNVAILVILGEVGSIAGVLNGEFEDGGIGMPDWLETPLERIREMTYVALAGISYGMISLETMRSIFSTQQSEGYDVRHAQFPYSMLPSGWRELILKTPAPPVSGLATLLPVPTSETSEPTVQNRSLRRQQERTEKQDKKKK